MVNSWEGAKGSMGPIRQELELERNPVVTKTEMWGRGPICSVATPIPQATDSVLRRLPPALCLPPRSTQPGCINVHLTLLVKNVTFKARQTWV